MLSTPRAADATAAERPSHETASIDLEAAGYLTGMHRLISMLGILTTLAVVMGIFLLVYRYHDPRGD